MLQRRVMVACSVLLCVVATTAPARADERLHFAVLADVDGQFAAFDCRQGNQQALPAVIASIQARAGALRQQGKTLQTLVPGDFIGTSTAARHLLTRAKDGATRLAAALASAGTLLHGVGNGEFALPPAALERYLQALRGAGIVTGAVNLTCDASRTAICGQGAATAATVVRPIDGVSVGAFALQYDDFSGKVDRAHMRGLEFVDAAPATVAALKSLATRGAKLRLGVVHRGRHGSPEEELTQMAEALNGWVDVLITDGVPAGAEVPRVLRVGSGDKAVTVISVPGGAWVWYEVVLDVDADGHVSHADVVPHAVGEDDHNDPKLAAWLTAEQRAFCATWGGSVGQLKLEQPYDAADFVWLVLYIMREVAGADVSVINQGAFALERAFPLKDTISRVDLYQILRFPNRLRVIEVSGEDLEALIELDPGSDAGKRDLHWVGVDSRDGQLLINGRALDRRLSYRLVTNDFLVRGGDGTFEGLSGAEKLPGRDRQLREYVEAWLVARGAKPLGSPAAAFPDLWDRPLWTISGQGKLDFTSISFGNRAGYIDPRLNNLSFTQVDAALDGNLRMSTRDHGWTGRLVFQFTKTSSGGAEFVNADVALGETSYEFRRLRDTWLNRAWWAPILTAYGRARGEFDVPTTQPFRFFDVDALLGCAWELLPGLQLRAGGGANTELLRVNPDPYLRSMVHAGLVLQRYPIATIGQSQLLLQLEGDVRLKGLTSDRRLTTYIDATVLARVFGPLMVYAQYQWFGLRADGPTQDLQQPSAAGTWSGQSRVSAGLALTAIGSLQMR